MAQSFEERLCAILVKNKALEKQEAKTLKQEFKDHSKAQFDDFLLSENLVKKEDLLKALSELYQVPSFDVVGYLFDHELLTEFPQDVLVRYALIPLQRDENILVIVASNPDNEELLPELAEYVSDEIQFNVGIKKDIVDMVLESYEESPFHTDEEEVDDEDEDEGELYEDDFYDGDDNA
jgi:type IV pilus assembly protein PilB